MTIRGMALAKSVPMAKTLHEVTINQDLKAVIPGQGLDPDFLLYAALSRRGDLLALVGTAAHGTKRLGTNQLAALSIPFPPLDEQHRIVRILSTIQRASDASTKLIGALLCIRSALSHKLFPRFLSQAPHYIAGRKVSWRECLLGDVIALQRGFDITKKDQHPGNVPVVSSGGIRSWHDRAAVEGPGVVIGRKGSLGTAHFIDGDYWPHDTTLWVTDFNGNYPKYVYFFLRQLDVAHLDVGASNPTLNRNHLYPTPVVWPDQDGQAAIMTMLEAIEARLRAEHLTAQSLNSVFTSALAGLLPGHLS